MVCRLDRQQMFVAPTFFCRVDFARRITQIAAFPYCASLVQVIWEGLGRFRFSTSPPPSQAVEAAGPPNLGPRQGQGLTFEDLAVALRKRPRPAPFVRTCVVEYVHEFFSDDLSDIYSSHISTSLLTRDVAVADRARTRTVPISSATHAGGRPTRPVATGQPPELWGQIARRQGGRRPEDSGGYPEVGLGVPAGGRPASTLLLPKGPRTEGYPAAAPCQSGRRPPPRRRFT